jgi:transcriptional regulator with XRE-family HTH domain
MDDLRVGAAFRAVRQRRRWRQSDVATRAGVSQSFVSLVERGHLDMVSLETLRDVARVLDIRLDLHARWRGGSLERLLSARHSQLAESVAADFAPRDGWQIAPEVSFSVYGERGSIDMLAFHEPSRSLLVIELKTQIVDVNELIGTLDRKHRLALGIARERGWHAAQVSRWLIVSRDRTNLRHIDAHRAVLRAAFPVDGRSMGRWLRDPCGPVSALSPWPDTDPGGARPSRGQRVRPPTDSAPHGAP